MRPLMDKLVAMLTSLSFIIDFSPIDGERVENH